MLQFAKVHSGSVHDKLPRRFDNWHGKTQEQRNMKINAEVRLTRVDKAIRRKLLFLLHRDRQQQIPDGQKRVTRVNPMQNGVIRFRGGSEKVS